MLPCPLCKDENSRHYHTDKKRDYFQCASCKLVFVPPAQRLDSQTEKSIYDQHENDIDDPGYRRFLSRFAQPLMERIPNNASGIDYGCGPGPALAAMLREDGYEMTLYDIYYFPDEQVLKTGYDFLTATEVIEHIYQPDKVWNEWLNLVTPGGWIGIMTKLVINADAFSRWHYKNDQTHVCFYSRETFEFLALRDELQLEFVGNDVILLRKTQ